MSSMPCSLRGLDLPPGRRPELRLELAAETAKSSRGHHRLSRAADPDREVVVRAADGRRDGGGHGAVGDELDARAGAPDVLDQVLVTRAVEDDRRDVVGRTAERLGDRLDVLLDRPQAGRRRHAHAGRPRSGACTCPAGEASSRGRRRRRSTSRPGRRARPRPGPRADRARGRPLHRRRRSRVPATSCSASSSPPMTTRPEIGSESSADRMPENAASSALSWLPAPRNRALRECGALRRPRVQLAEAGAAQAVVSSARGHCRPRRAARRSRARDP